MTTDAPAAGPDAPLPRAALVTGATGTLGMATVLALADAGYDVAIHHRDSDGAAQALRAQVRARGRRAVVAAADLACREVDEVCRDLLDEAAKLGPLDLLVLAASSQEVVPWPDLDTTGWDRLYASTLRHTAALLQAGAQRMDRRRGPAIVVVGSIEGYRPAPGHAGYAVFKAAIHQLVAAAAQQLGPRGIRVVGVAPGLIDRPSLTEDWPQGLARWQAASPLGRPVTAGEVADTIAFLGSAKASGITGVTIPVDAGWSCAPGW